MPAPVISIEAQIEDALFAHLDAVPLSPPLPIAYNGVGFERLAGVLHLEASFHSAPTMRLFVDSGAQHAHSGFLQVSVMGVPKDHSDIYCRDLGATVADHFAEDIRIDRNGGPSVRITNRPTISAGFRDGPWWNVPVTINWQFLG